MIKNDMRSADGHHTSRSHAKIGAHLHRWRGTVLPGTTPAGRRSFSNRLLECKYGVFAVFACQESLEEPFSFPALREKKTESSFLILSPPQTSIPPRCPHYSKVFAGCGAVFPKRAPHSPTPSSSSYLLPLPLPLPHTALYVSRRFFSSLRISRRRSFPTLDLGSMSRNSIYWGIL